MKTSMIPAAWLVLAAATALAAGRSVLAPEAENEAIIQTALDYSDGAYSGDGARMERALQTDLNKVTFGRMSPAMGLSTRYSTFSGLVEPTRLGLMSLEPEKRLTECQVLEIKDDVACVRVKTALWCDYLQMIKIDGRWKIVNVLWTRGLNTPPQAKVVPGFDAEKERPAARAAALDYIEARLTGDAVRLEKVLHPETNHVTLMSMEVAGKKASFLMKSRFSGILEPVKAKAGLPPENARGAEVRILDLMDGMAFAAARTSSGAAYLQLQLIDGRWMAINILDRPANNLIAPPGAKR